MRTEPTLGSGVRSLRFPWAIDRTGLVLAWPTKWWWERLALAALAIFFVLVGAIDLDLGPGEARLGLAAGERPGPLGQAVGYWAADLWPAEVLPSYVLAQLDPGGRPSSAAVRWPAAIAGILAGWLIARGTSRGMGTRAGLLAGLCWFGSLALIDRSGAIGLDLIVGLAVLATIQVSMTDGSRWGAGFWAAIAFLAGGLPPLVLIALVFVVLGRHTAALSPGMLVPPVAAILFWSAWTSVAISPEICASALVLPFTQKPAWFLAPGIVAIALPFSPFALVAMAPSARRVWDTTARSWLNGWFQATVASLIAGSLVPGLAIPARVVALAGVSLGAAAGLDTALRRNWRGGEPGLFHALLGRRRDMAFRHDVRDLHLDLVSGLLPRARDRDERFHPLRGRHCWLALARRHARLAIFTLLLVAIGLKLGYWCYYVPEWNYRYSQGPWARAIAQWIPRKWKLYTLHDWPADLAFFTKRTVRQLPSPHFLKFQDEGFCKFVLLLPAELENWPPSAPPGGRGEVSGSVGFRASSSPEPPDPFRCPPGAPKRGCGRFARPRHCPKSSLAHAECLRPGHARDNRELIHA